MPNPLKPIFDTCLRPRPVRMVRRLVMGLAHDFWHDGTHQPFGIGVAKQDNGDKKKKAPSFDAQRHVAATPSAPAKPVFHEWHAEPGEISEKMWGDGYVTPADEEVTEMLINPLGLNKDMSVLDLSAGLGGRLRRTTQEFKVYITGLEPDPQIAARGMELSIKAGKGKHIEIAAYDPANFSVARRYDCIIARETFYRVDDRAAFFAALAAATKPGAQITFTDYIVNPENRDHPAVKAWIANESGANPASVVEMAETWAKAGFKLRVHDDQTDFYMKHVKDGLRRLAVFMAGGHRPDAETKMALVRRLRTWSLRIAAMHSGMRFYRFYGTKM